MDEIIRIDTVDQYNKLYGLENLHPLVGVIDLTKATNTVDHLRINMGIYSLFLKQTKCGDLKYGKKQYAQQYILFKLISLAKDQMLNTNQSLTQIACGLGFQNTQHFSRLFKNNVGCSPNEYRIQNNISL